MAIEAEDKESFSGSYVNVRTTDVSSLTASASIEAASKKTFGETLTVSFESVTSPSENAASVHPEPGSNSPRNM